MSDNLSMPLATDAQTRARQRALRWRWLRKYPMLVFGAVFAINSSLHSYLIVSYAGRDGVSLDVGFYYMANALGRLVGTLLSGWVFQLAGQGDSGLQACLWVSSAMLVLAVLISLGLPSNTEQEEASA